MATNASSPASSPADSDARSITGMLARFNTELGRGDSGIASPPSDESGPSQLEQRIFVSSPADAPDANFSIANNSQQESFVSCPGNNSGFQEGENFDFSANRSAAFNLSCATNTTGAFRTPSTRALGLRPPAIPHNASSRNRYSPSTALTDSRCSLIPEEEVAPAASDPHQASFASMAGPHKPSPDSDVSGSEKENRSTSGSSLRPGLFANRRLSVLGRGGFATPGLGLKRPTIATQSSSCIRAGPSAEPKGTLLAKAASASSGVRMTPMDAGHSAMRAQRTIPPMPSFTPAKAASPPPLRAPAPVHPRPSTSKAPITKMDSENKILIINGKTYQILSLIGSGGSSKVFQVFDPQKETIFAVKVVDLSGEAEDVKQAYRNEVALLKRLQFSDRVIRLFDSASTGNQDFLLMEQGGTDLSKFLKRRTAAKEPYDAVMIAFIWRSMLLAVNVIHSEGIVHSDIKPANFLFVAGVLKLIDFGIASTVTGNATSATVAVQMGTINYMSPEAVENAGRLPNDPSSRISTKSDVWSLGCILYYLAFGTTPFGRLPSTSARMLAILSKHSPIPFPAEAHHDPALVACLRRCLERDPRRRPSVPALLDDAYLADGTTAPARVAQLRSTESVVEAIKNASPRTAQRLLESFAKESK